MKTATPLSYTTTGAAAATGLSAKTISRAIKAKHLRAKRSHENEDGSLAGPYVIFHTDLMAWLEGMPDA